MPKKEQYTVEAILVEGTGVPDGDLVTRYINGKVNARMFVPAKTLKVILKDRDGPAAAKPSVGKKPSAAASKFIYARMPTMDAANQKAVIVQDKSNMGQLVRTGAAEEVGAVIVTVLFKALASLFT
jgi:hypothetical protein